MRRMAGLVAECGSCGLRFQDRSNINLGEGSSVYMRGNVTRCPRCGGWANYYDGAFTVKDGVLEVLSATELTRERIEAMAAVARLARDGTITSEEAADRLSDAVPAIGDALSRVPPRLRSAVLTVLWSVVMLLAGQALAESRDDSASPADVRRAVEQGLRECRRAQAPAPRPTRREATHEGGGRNGPCPCGSRRKLKKCCG